MIQQMTPVAAIDVQEAATTAFRMISDMENQLGRARALLHGMSTLIGTLEPNEDVNALQALATISEADLEQAEAVRSAAASHLHPLVYPRP